MKIIDVVRRSGRNLRSAKARTVLTALAIGVGAFTLTLTLAASNGASAYVNKIIKDNFDPAELIVAADKVVLSGGTTDVPREYDDSFARDNTGSSQLVKRLEDSDISKLRATAGVEDVREGITLDLQYTTRPGQKRYVTSVSAFSPARNPTLLAGSIPKPLSSRDIIIPESFVGAYGFTDPTSAIGQKVTLALRKSVDQAALLQALASGVDQSKIKQLTTEGTEEISFTVVAVAKKTSAIQPGTELYLYIANSAALELNDIATKGTNNYRKYTFAYVRVVNGTDKAALTAVQDKIKAMGYTAQSVEDTEKFLTKIITVLQGIVAAFGAIAVIASLFGVINTMYISVIQRTREIGLMKALGMRRKDIGRLFRFEAAWIGFLGGALGSLAAFITGTLLNPWITTKLSLEGQKLLIFKATNIAILILMLVIVAIVAGLVPARKAAKLDPIEALRTE